MIERKIKDFFEWNKDSASYMVIWDLFKARIHGILIAFKIARDKRHEEARTALVGIIQRLEEENKQEVSEV